MRELVPCNLSTAFSGTLLNPTQILLEGREMATAVVAGNQEKLFVGRESAAKLLDVSTRTIDDAIRTGTLEAFRIGRRVLIRRDALIQFAQRVAA